MISTLLVSAASTAACPRMIPPTIPSVCPIRFGSLAPASRKNSIVVSRNMASTKGNGTFCLDEINLPSSSLGMTS